MSSLYLENDDNNNNYIDDDDDNDEVEEEEEEINKMKGNQVNVHVIRIEIKHMLLNYS